MRKQKEASLTVQERGLVRTAPGWAVVRHLVPWPRAGLGAQQDWSPFPGITGSCDPGMPGCPLVLIRVPGLPSEGERILFLPWEQNDRNK